MGKDRSAAQRLVGGQKPSRQSASEVESHTSNREESTHATQDRLVQVLLHIGRENDGAGKLFDLLEQKSDLAVGVAIVRILDFSMFPKQGVGFVDEENGIGPLHFIKQAIQMFVGLADIFAPDGAIPW